MMDDSAHAQESVGTQDACGLFVKQFEINSNLPLLYLRGEAELVDGSKGICLVSGQDEDGADLAANDLGLIHSRMFASPYFYFASGAIKQVIELRGGISKLTFKFFADDGSPLSVKDIVLSETVTEQGAFAADEDENVPATIMPPISNEGTRLFAGRGAGTTGISLMPIDDSLVYSHRLELVQLDDRDVDRARHCVYVPQFYDDRLEPLDPPSGDWSMSQKFGAFRYLASGSGVVNELALVPPEGAHYFGFEIFARSDKDRFLVKEEVEPSGLHPGAQLEKLNREFDGILDVDPDRLLLIYTGTTRIGEKNRANRSMKMAELMAARGWHVVYVYHRARRALSILDPQPTQVGSGSIVQVPNDLFQNFSMRIAQQGRGAGTAILSMPDPTSVPLGNTLKSLDWKTFYEARDDWEEFARVGAARWYETSIERELCRNVDMTLAVSPPLRSKCISFGVPEDKAVILPNGAGQAFVDHYRQTAPQPRGERTKIGYFGHLTTQWFDWPALLAAARKNPYTEFEIIGHGDIPDIFEPNIALLGPKSHDEIIAIAQTWDLGLIPFVPGKLANAVDPIKIYEYACLRLKAVSIYMEQISDYPNTFLYRHSSDLGSLLETALAADFDEDGNAAFVAQAGWENRMDELERLIGAISR